MNRSNYQLLARKEYQRLCAENNYQVSDDSDELYESQADEISSEEEKLAPFEKKVDPRLIKEEKLRYIATAIRAEKTLREQLSVMSSSRKHMADMMKDG